jgi:2-dehydro-3-deoxyphosphooctonate aldolase (KDO 8-P synthase)
VEIVQVGRVAFGERALVLVAGPCVIESEHHAVAVARAVASTAARLQMPAVFKASFDKANRTSAHAFRGPGLDQGLAILTRVKAETGLPVLTDIHEAWQAAPAAAVADVLQIPAFLCRQTDLLVAAARTGRAVNVKKGQFLAPGDMRHAIEKLTTAGTRKILLTERGTSFGYHDLVVDMRGLPQLRALGFPVIFDVTHSLQLPGAGDGRTTGQAGFIDTLASAGVAAGVDAVFLEVHEEPSRARSDADNALRLDRLEPLLRRLLALHAVAPVAHGNRPDVDH